MRTEWAVCFLTALLATIYDPSVAQPSVYLINMAASSFSLPPPPEAANVAASSGKRIVEQLVKNDKEYAQVLGFQSADEATGISMKLGRAIPIMRISIESLKAYGPRSDVASLLKPTDQFIYPITVGGKVRSSITVKKMRKTGEWKAAAFGAVGAPLAAEQLKISDSAFIVRLYELERWFLGAPSGGELTLFSLRLDPTKLDPSQRVSIGKQENGRDALAKLVEEAKTFDYSAHKKRSRLKSVSN